MGKYIVQEGKTGGDFIATNKARSDIDKTAISCGFKPLSVTTNHLDDTSKISKSKKLIYYLENRRIWRNSIKTLTAGDTLLIQFPLANPALFMSPILKTLRKKNIKIILLIHDLDSLRYVSRVNTAYYQRAKIEENAFLKNADYIIAHNPTMKRKLSTLFSIPSEKIISLNLFDYLLPEATKSSKTAKSSKNSKTSNAAKVTPPKYTKTPHLIIAGNLSSEKAPYLKKLKTLKTLNFNLYGVGETKDLTTEKIHYCGKFPPDELPKTLRGEFGLVWDGPSLKTCSGDFGNYLKLNNPHKVSLYLASSRPVIIWSKSALADFITKNHLGFAISSLSDLPPALKKIDEKTYRDFQAHIQPIRKKLIAGDFLKTALKSTSEE